MHKRKRDEIPFYKRIIHSSNTDCHDLIRMTKRTFFRLANIVRQKESLTDTVNLTLEEQLVMFLHILGHNLRNRKIVHNFGHSGETVSRYFNKVLTAILALHVDYLLPPRQNTPLEISGKDRFDPYFKRKDFKNARVYKRQPFFYYNELVFIVGNDVADGNITTTPQETEEGHIMDDSVDPNYDEDFAAPFQSAADLGDDDIPAHTSTQSAASNSQNCSSLLSKRPKRKGASMAGSLDAICETINQLGENMIKSQTAEMDGVYSEMHAVLQAIPGISEEIMVDAYAALLVEPAMAKGFLIMNEAQRVIYIRRKFGSL